MNSGGREGLANGNGFRPHQRMVTPKMFKTQYKKSKTDIKTATGARILYKPVAFAWWVTVFYELIECFAPLALQ